MGKPSAAPAGAVAAAFARLSPRQQEVATLLLQGQSNKIIARRLALSEGTVKAHVSAIFQVVGARSRVEAVIIAAKSGIQAEHIGGGSISTSGRVHTLERMPRTSQLCESDIPEFA